jgi:hypothetical protein
MAGAGVDLAAGGMAAGRKRLGTGCTSVGRPSSDSSTSGALGGDEPGFGGGGIALAERACGVTDGGLGVPGRCDGGARSPRDEGPGPGDERRGAGVDALGGGAADEGWLGAGTDRGGSALAARSALSAWGPLGGACDNGPICSSTQLRSSAAALASINERMSSPASDALSAAFFNQRRPSR